ncbi:MAG TPA: O-antigen ligase family protein [Thermoanaerobaculia bacterium]|nr:O-antigen ligase family protein [Thermoanaerobaculia bacterium]
MPFGSVQPWAEAVLWSLAAVAVVTAAVEPAATRRVRRVGVPAAALVGLAGLGWLQSLPLPDGVAALLSPRHLEVWRQASVLAGQELAPRLTLAPEASRDAALAFAAAAAALVAAALAGVRRIPRRVLLAGLLVGTFFPLAYGLRQWLARSGEVWGVDVALADRLRGTFVNSNHFAVQIELALAVVFAWGWWSLRQARRAGSNERRLVLVAPPVVLWVLLFLGLALTGSRAGLLSALVAVAVQAALPAVGTRRWRRAAAGLLVAAAGLAAVVAVVGVEMGLGRILATSADEVTVGARMRVAAQSFELWQRYPLTGSGLGTFRDAFPAVQGENQWTGAWHHAHNDWVELLVTAGLVGAVLLLVGLGALSRRLFAVLRAGRSGEERAAALAALGALASLAVHELFDFGLALPTHAFTLAVVCGVAAGGSRHRGETADLRPAAGRRRHLDEVEPRAGLGGEVEPAPRTRPHDVELSAVELDLEQGAGMSLADLDVEGGDRS